MQPASYNHLIVSDDFHIETGWDKICEMDPEEPRIRDLVAEATEMLEDWTSDDEDSDFNINDDEEQFGSNFFDENIFDDKPPPPQEQLDFFDFDMEKEECFTCRVAPVSLQNFTSADNKTYRESFENLAESMRRSQETRSSLKFRSYDVKEATKYWEKRWKSISTVLCSIEVSSMQIQQTYFHSTHALNQAHSH